MLGSALALLIGCPADVPPTATDTTAPTFTAQPSAVSVGENNATISVTVDKGGMLFWVLYDNDVSAPENAAALIADASGSSGVARSGSDGVVVTADTPQTITISGLIANTAYDFYAVALDSAENATVSNKLDISTAPDNIPPAAVTNVMATPSVDKINLTWSNPADSDLQSISIAWTPNDGSANVDAPTASYTVTNIDSDTAYTFTVVAFDSSGNPSASGSTASATSNIFYAIALETALDFTLPSMRDAYFILDSAVESDSGYYIDAPDGFSAGVNDATLDSNTLIYDGVASGDTIYLAETWMALPPENGAFYLTVSNDTASDLSDMVRVRKSPFYLPFGDYSGDELGHGPLLVTPPGHKIYIELIELGDWTTSNAFFTSHNGGNIVFDTGDPVGDKRSLSNSQNSAITPVFEGLSASEGITVATLSPTPISIGTMRFRLSSAP